MKRHISPIKFGEELSDMYKFFDDRISFKEYKVGITEIVEGIDCQLTVFEDGQFALESENGLIEYGVDKIGGSFDYIELIDFLIPALRSQLKEDFIVYFTLSGGKDKTISSIDINPNQFILIVDIQHLKSCLYMPVSPLDYVLRSVLMRNNSFVNPKVVFDWKPTVIPFSNVESYVTPTYSKFSGYSIRGFKENPVRFGSLMRGYHTDMIFPATREKSYRFILKTEKEVKKEDSELYKEVLKGVRQEFTVGVLTDVVNSLVSMMGKDINVKNLRYYADVFVATIIGEYWRGNPEKVKKLSLKEIADLNKQLKKDLYDLVKTLP